MRPPCPGQRDLVLGAILGQVADVKDGCDKSNCAHFSQYRHKTAFSRHKRDHARQGDRSFQLNKRRRLGHNIHADVEILI
jgi:hypothetical protein